MIADDLMSLSINHGETPLLLKSGKNILTDGYISSYDPQTQVLEYRVKDYLSSWASGIKSDYEFDSYIVIEKMGYGLFIDAVQSGAGDVLSFRLSNRIEKRECPNTYVCDIIDEEGSKNGLISRFRTLDLLLETPKGSWWGNRDFGIDFKDIINNHIDNIPFLNRIFFLEISDLISIHKNVDGSKTIPIEHIEKVLIFTIESIKEHFAYGKTEFLMDNGVRVENDLILDLENYL